VTAFAFGASFGAGGAWEHWPVWVWPWCAPDQRDAVAFSPRHFHHRPRACLPRRL